MNKRKVGVATSQTHSGRYFNILTLKLTLHSLPTCTDLFPIPDAPIADLFIASYTFHCLVPDQLIAIIFICNQRF
jgi:hypothetical protein